MRHPPERKAEALDLVAQCGAAEASRRLGIPKGTIDSWASRARVPAPDPNPAQIERRLATIAERKARLADELLDTCQQLKAQLFAPCVERKAMAGPKREIEIVDIHLDQPSFVDQRAIMISIAVAVDKVQILTGEATERTEHLIAGTEERRRAALAVVEQLADRRSA
jgi:transposase-like protein